MSSNLQVVNICLGIEQQMFRFSPNKLHDLYAIQNVLYIELIVDDSFIVPYEFPYLDIDDLLVDFKALEKRLAENID
ncbi:hypothetical protein D3C81_1930550 [compost metagenome]